jgi:hypothetical protein
MLTDKGLAIAESISEYNRFAVRQGLGVYVLSKR